MKFTYPWLLIVILVHLVAAHAAFAKGLVLEDVGTGLLLVATCTGGISASDHQPFWLMDLLPMGIVAVAAFRALLGQGMVKRQMEFHAWPTAGLAASFAFDFAIRNADLSVIRPHKVADGLLMTGGTGIVAHELSAGDVWRDLRWALKHGAGKRTDQ